MSSYSDRFGGSLVQVADPSYAAINLNANIPLSWPTQFQNINQVVAKIMDVTPDQGGRTITMPDTTLVSVGTDFLMVNVGAFSFNLLKNDASLLATIAAGQAIYFYLINNTTAAGTWRITPFGQGVSVVTEVAAEVPNATDAANLAIAGSPIDGSGILRFSFLGDLAQLIGFGGGTGLAARTAANTWQLRAITIAPNGNLTVTNPQGVGGDIILDLNDGIGIPPRNLISSMRIGNIGFATNTITVTQTNQNLSLVPNGTGEVQSSKSYGAINGASVKFYNNGNTNYVSLSGSNVNYTLNLQWASTVPTVGQILQYQSVLGVPTLGFATVPTFVSVASTDKAIARYSGTAGQLQDSGVTIADNNNVNTPGTMTANSFISGNLQIGTTNNIQSSAGDITISPATPRNLVLQSNVIIGSAGGTDNNRSLYLRYNNNTVALSPSATLAADIAFTLPATLPVDNNSVLQCTSTGVLSFVFLAPAVLKSWGVFTGATGVVLASYNMNIARTGAGEYDITLPTPMSSVNYSIVAGAEGAIFNFFHTTRTVNSFHISARNAGGVAADPTSVSIQVSGIQ